jgi:hypothetical protein
VANALYPKWKQALLEFTANNDLDGQTVKVALVTAGYTYSSSDQYYSSVTASVVGTPQTLGSKTFTNGVFDAADVLYTSVSGSQVVSLVIYIDTGNAATSPLVAFIDTGVTNLPVTPNGGDIAIAWNASGIFAL